MFSNLSLSYLKKKQLINLKKILSNPKSETFRKTTLKGNMPRPQFALGLYMCFLQAKQLRYKKVSIIEFNLLDDEDALIDLVFYCEILKKIFFVNFNIYSIRYKFDLNSFSKYDRLNELSKVKEKEKKFFKKKYSKYYIDGNKNLEIKKMVKSFKLSPVGFCSFDLKNNTLTDKALKIFKKNQNFFLPRTIFYFDHFFKSNKFEGEYLSIDKFNKNSKNKISDILEFPEQLSIIWTKWLYLAKRIKVLANFNHKHYSTICKDFF